MRHLLVFAVLSGCVDPTADTTVAQDVESSNRLSSNSLGANPFLLASLADGGLNQSTAELTTLVDDPAGREQLGYLVSCALNADRSLAVVGSDGATYSFAGALGLADSWRDHAPPAADRRWVSACMLARTNYFHIAVPLSLRGANSKLGANATEKATYTQVEAAFYGDLFASPQVMVACASPLDLTQPQVSTFPLRVCALSADGVTTNCGFAYGGNCASYCAIDPANGFYKTCGTVKEVITSFLEAP